MMPQLPNLQQGGSSLAYNFKRSPLNVEAEDYDKRRKVTATFSTVSFKRHAARSNSQSLQSDLEDAFGPAYGNQFSKRGEAADRLRNILNKYKQGSNCKYKSLLNALSMTHVEHDSFLDMTHMNALI